MITFYDLQKYIAVLAALYTPRREPPHTHESRCDFGLVVIKRNLAAKGRNERLEHRDVHFLDPTLVLTPVKCGKCRARGTSACIERDQRARHLKRWGLIASTRARDVARRQNGKPGKKCDLQVPTL